MSKKGQELESQACPRAREKDLSITVLGDETVVYDHLTHNASCLNTVTAIVWKASDGNNTVSHLVEILRESGFQDANTAIVQLALDELFKADLLIEAPAPAAGKTHSKSRRDAIKAFGKGAAMAIPAITAISIQPAIAAGSGVTGSPCDPANGGAECVTGVCLPIGQCT